jgi:predicted alpha/beta-hydrolase family hydrolase
MGYAPGKWVAAAAAPAPAGMRRRYEKKSTQKAASLVGIVSACSVLAEPPEALLGGRGSGGRPSACMVSDMNA